MYNLYKTITCTMNAFLDVFNCPYEDIIELSRSEFTCP